MNTKMFQTRWRLLGCVLFLACFYGQTQAALVTIPDANFRNFLTNSGTFGSCMVGTAPNKQLDTDCAATKTGAMICQGQGIASMSGIEYFTSITMLNCSYNSMSSLNVSQNVALTTLICQNTGLTSLNVSGAVNLQDLACNMNQLTSLDVSQNTQLSTRLDVAFNPLTSLNVTNNTLLKYLLCYNCNLPSLNVTQNTALEQLTCYSNQFTTLDVTHNAALYNLQCHNNLLTTLDLTDNPALTHIYCDNNQLTTLDVSQNTVLQYIRCDNNDINEFVGPLANSIYGIVATGNNITCLPNIPTQQFFNCDVAQNGFGSYVVCGPTQNCDWVTIPDANFRAFLVQTVPNMMLSEDPPGQERLNPCLAANYTGVFNCSNKSIANLSGIEKFTSLAALNCSMNQLTALDLSANTVLTSLDCSHNQIASLNITGVTQLATLRCQDNSISSLSVSPLFGLQTLDCSANPITSLMLSNCTQLSSLRCNSCQLSSLNVGNNTALFEIFCQLNQLTSLNVSNNSNLQYLNCENNLLPEFTGTLPNSLCDLVANDNTIECIPNLPSGCVSGFNCDVAQNGIGGFIICGQPNPCALVTIPDANFRDYLIQTFPGYMSAGKLNPCIAANFTGTIDCRNRNIADLTGIEHFTGLHDLYCSNNQLTALNVSALTQLASLQCDNNLLNSLNVSSNTALNRLECHFNNLSALNVSSLPALTILYCNSNNIATLNISANTNLSKLKCGKNLLTALNLSQNTNLTELYCEDNDITALNLTANTLMTYLDCSKNLLTALNVTANAALGYLGCSENQLTAFGGTLPNTLQEIVAAGGSNNIPCLPNLPASLVACDVAPNGSGGFLLCGNGVLNIASPANNFSVAEGASSYTTTGLVISLSGATTFPVVAKLTPAGNATFSNGYGGDFWVTGSGATVTSAGVTVTFTANGSKNLNLLIYGDGVIETDESATLNLVSFSGGASLGGNSSRTATILNDDMPVVANLNFSASTPSQLITEGNSGYQLIPIQITLSGANSFPVVAQISYAGSTALYGNTYGKDFNLTGLNTALQTTFTSNGTRYFNVVVLGETIFEGSEVVNLTLTSPTANVSITDNSRSVGIVNDDSPRLGEESTTTETGLSLYPNPNNGQFNLSFESVNGIATVMLFNSIGQVVLSQNFETIDGLNTYQIDASSLTSGVYNVQVQSVGKLYLSRLVKQ